MHPSVPWPSSFCQWFPLSAVVEDISRASQCIWLTESLSCRLYFCRVHFHVIIYYFIVILLQLVAVGITSAAGIEIDDVLVSKSSRSSQLPRPASVVISGGPVMGGSESDVVGR